MQKKEKPHADYARGLIPLRSFAIRTYAKIFANTVGTGFSPVLAVTLSDLSAKAASPPVGILTLPRNYLIYG